MGMGMGREAGPGGRAADSCFLPAPWQAHRVMPSLMLATKPAMERRPAVVSW